MSNPKNLTAYPSVYHTIANLWIEGKKDTIFIKGFETKNKAIAFSSRWHSFRKVWMEERIGDAPVLGAIICRKRQEEDGTWTVYFEDMDAEYEAITNQLLSQLGCGVSTGTAAQASQIPAPIPKLSNIPWIDEVFSGTRAPVNGKDFGAAKDEPSLTNSPGPGPGPEGEKK